MGIYGLTSYIYNRSHLYLKDYELHDTYLVIDGNSVICQIYNLYSKYNCAFGGDYDTYAQCVSQFFDDLLKCNVIPLVLLDGAYENKKLKTVLSRTRIKIRRASSFDPSTQQKMRFFPLFLKDVFKNVMDEKRIQCVQCLFEADCNIAAIARNLNCPVLSYDSDFYIYGTLYIPFNTLDNSVIRSSTGKGYAKHCKIYKVEYLLNSFKGLTESMLPLAAILLGNDYVKRSTFKNFFRHLKLRGASRKKFNHLQCRIETIFNWLSKYTLDKAIITVLSRLTKPMRQRILDIIENNINNYTCASIEMLKLLGIPEDYVAHVNINCQNKIYKFHGDINTLTYIEEACEDDTSEEEETEGQEEQEIRGEEEEEQEIEKAVGVNADTERIGTLNVPAISNSATVNRLPAWFVNNFLMAMYPPYFLGMITNGLYICFVQVEDHDYPSSAILSTKIVSVIFGLLKSEINSKICYLKYITRGQNRKILSIKLEATESICFYKLPSLSGIREISLITRMEILNNILGITNVDCIHEFPPEWMLYIGCINYWIKEQEPSVSHRYYLYSLFVCLLFNIIDSKIGRYRLMSHFQNRYKKRICIIEQNRKDNYSPQCINNVYGTIIDAYNKIDHDDCILAAPFFISHFDVDKKLYSNPKKFNRTIVHAFAEFQHCLKHTMDLNALFELPYEQSKVANLFNGTLLYNLSTNFKARFDIERYINTVLQKCPSLLTFFTVFLSKVKPMFPLLLQNNNPKVNYPKRQKTSSKHLKSSKNTAEDDDNDEYFSADDMHDAVFHDPNNRFSLLHP